MFYTLINHAFTNEVQSVSQIFYPNERFLPVSEPPFGVTVVSALTETCAETEIYVDKILRAKNAAPIGAAPEDGRKKAAKYAVAKSAYEAFLKVCGAASPWGIALGIRPTKMVNEMRAQGLPEGAIREKLKNFFLMSDEKTGLAVKVSAASQNILSKTPRNAVSLYVGVPFCPSRCLYCSFSSYIHKKYARAINGYLNALFSEIEAVLPYLRGKTLAAVYIGGGTPASLTAGELKSLLGFIAKRVNPAQGAEYTVEGGRPDALDAEKLLIIKNHGVNRLCVNPQTLNDGTLKAIGRAHTARDFFRAYGEAEKHGFKINSDIIAGLCGESFEDFKRTTDALLALCPDSVTVHALCVKRASALKERMGTGEARFPPAETAARMLDYAYESCGAAKLFPYYLYRQKNTAGNLENTGYAKTGAECLYNVFITEEKQTIVGVGAGAVTKRFDEGQNRVTRVFNPKTPEEYIKRTGEIIERKKNFL